MKGAEQPPDVMGSASLLSRLTISFPYTMMRSAYRRPLGIGDVPQLPAHLASRVTGLALLRARAQRPEKSLLFATAWLWRSELCWALLLSMLWNALFVLTPALLFPGLIFFLQDPTQPSWIGWVYVGAFLLASLLSSLVYSHAWFRCFLFAARAKAAVSFFAVTCALSREALGSDTGLFVNLLGNDTERVFNFLQHFPYGISSIVGLGGIVAALFVWMGPAPASIALGLSALSFVLQRLVALRNASIRSRAIPLADERVQRTGEVVSAIQLVKLYAWEGPRSDQISALRRQEVRWLFWSALLQNYSAAVVVVVFWISLWGSLSCYLLLGGAVSAPVLFTIVSLFANLRFPLQMLANLFFFYGDSYQSFARVDSLVTKLGAAAAEESEPKYELLTERRVCKQDELLLSIVNGSFRYAEPGVDVASVEPTLSNVNLEVRAGRVACVVGAVGSGKSTLCAGLVGEASAVGVSISGTLSYAAQTAWIWNATLRDNICFGRPFDEGWYREVVAACQLVTDFDSFPAGDSTFVGERGVTLSGGQRQRISIARAVYADRSLIVLDDVTSALDARVARRLFEHLIIGLLRERNKGVLLITHQLPLCRHADTTVVLEAGRQMQSGAFAEVQKVEGPFRAMMRHYEEEEEGGDDSPVAGKKMSAAVDKMKKKSRDAMQTVSPSRTTLASDGPTAEESKEGAVSGKVWTSYVSLLGRRMAGLTFLSACAWNAVRVLADWWIVYLITGTFFASLNAFVFSWLGLTLGCVVLLLLQGTLFVRASANAGQRLHDRVFFTVLAAPMSWFDVTPVGRVTNRLAKDLDAVDKLLPYSLDQFLQCILQCIAVVILIAVALPWFLIALPFIFALFVLLSNFFRRSSTQLRRIDGIVRAPCFSSLTEALAGRVTIHSLGNGPMFAARLVALCDVWHSSLFAFWSTTRFFSLRLDVATSAVILCVTIISVSLRSASPASAAVAAVALSYSLRLSALLQWAVRQLAEGEAFMSSVERLLQFADIQPEGNASDAMPPKGWIESGSVAFENVTVQYGRKPPVLRGLSFSVRAGEKIGIVGRTGAGKSTIVSSLFRLVECAGGAIRIDGVDISRIRLHELRRSLAIIPQDPVLFVGTLRDNLDPFGEFSSDEVEGVCQRVQLPLDLSSPIEAGGSNLSLGERQLVCVGRAMLRKARILVLDEATASVDTATDAILQRVMRREFAQATVITVAHRLNTVVDCDRVMVLDAGALIEFDAPRSLVSREGSRFSQLLADTGARSARHLTAVALSVPLRVDEAGEEKGEGAAEEEAMEADWSLQTVVV